MGLNEVLDLPTRRRLLFAMLKLRGVAPRWRVKYTHFEEFDLNEIEIRRALVDLTSEEGWISVGDEYLGHLGMTKTGDVGVITGVWCPKQDEIETYLPLYVVSLLSFVSLIYIKRKLLEHATLKCTLKYCVRTQVQIEFRIGTLGKKRHGKR